MYSLPGYEQWNGNVLRHCFKILSNCADVTSGGSCMQFIPYVGAGNWKQWKGLSTDCSETERRY